MIGCSVRSWSGSRIWVGWLRALRKGVLSVEHAWDLEDCGVGHRKALSSRARGWHVCRSWSSNTHLSTQLHIRKHADSREIQRSRLRASVQQNQQPLSSRSAVAFIVEHVLISPLDSYCSRAGSPSRGIQYSLLMTGRDDYIGSCIGQCVGQKIGTSSACTTTHQSLAVQFPSSDSEELPRRLHGRPVFQLGSSDAGPIRHTVDAVEEKAGHGSMPVHHNGHDLFGHHVGVARKQLHARRISGIEVKDISLANMASKIVCGNSAAANAPGTNIDGILFRAASTCEVVSPQTYDRAMYAQPSGISSRHIDATSTTRSPGTVRAGPGRGMAEPCVFARGRMSDPWSRLQPH